MAVQIKDPRLVQAIDASRKLGEQLRAGKITKQVNDQRVQALVQWADGQADKPTWIDNGKEEESN